MVAPKVSSAVAQSNGIQVLVTFDQDMKQDAAFFNLANWTISGSLAVTVVAGPSATTALLTVSPEMLTGKVHTLTVNTAVENVLNEAMDPGFNTAVFNGLGVPPEVLSVVPTSSVNIRVTFTEPLTDNAALVDPDNYVFTAAGGAAPIAAVTSIIQEAVSNPTFVDIPVNEMTDAATYTLIVKNVGGNILDAVGNILDPADPANTVNFTGVGVQPDVAGAEVLAGNIIRITFSEPMRRDAALELAANYLFTPVSAGAAQLFFDSIRLPPVIAQPTFVEIVVSEMTDGATYDVTVNNGIGGPTDPGFNRISATDTATFTGEGVSPEVSQVIAISKNRADIVFNEPMRNNLDINTASKYAWDNGLVTLDVLEVTPAGVVKLATNDQVPGVLYTLTVTP